MTSPTLTLIRNATLLLDLGAGPTLLIDPMLNPAGAVPSVEDTAPDRPNPLVELPWPAEEVVTRAEAVLVTHLHNDHFDATARELLPREMPLLRQPADRDTLGQHETALGSVSGFVLTAPQPIESTQARTSQASRSSTRCGPPRTGR